jgi:RNA polymerase sigma-70 factor (ECF subfamily)
VLDDWLVLAAQGGDAAAFEALASRWNRRLIAHAYRRIGHAEGAAEASQEAWMAIVRGLPTLGDPSRFPAWACRIVDRKAVDWLRRRRRDRAIDDRLGHDPALRAEPTDPGPGAEAPRAEADALAVERLRRLLRELPAEQRALLGMFYADGRSVREIAHALGIPEGTVKSRLFLARKSLKTRMGDRP